MITEDNIRAALLHMALEKYPHADFASGHDAIVLLLEHCSRSSDTFCQKLAEALFITNDQ